jgi:predicted nucleic acid-binding protein
MSQQKVLVVDANILIRAALGRRARQILRKYADSVHFCAPDVCFDDARKYVTEIALQKGMNLTETLAFMEQIESIVKRVDRGLYQSYEQRARRRLDRRDSDDWPIAAIAMQAGCPIWTEDRDFFGSGIAIWTTDLVELYLREES